MLCNETVELSECGRLRLCMWRGLGGEPFLAVVVFFGDYNVV